MRLFAQTAIILLIFVSCVFLSPARAENQPAIRGEINGQDINVRTDSTVAAESICAVKKGAHVTLAGESYDWYKIRLPHYAPAYVHKDFVLTAEGTNNGKITKDNVNIRLRPDLGAPILGRVHKNETVAVIKSAGDWYKIEPPETAVGWINKNFVDMIEAKKPAEEEKKPVQDAMEENIIIEGVLKTKFFTGTAAYKLVSSTGDMYLIRGDRNLLAPCVRKTVRITGKTINSAEAALPIVRAEKIETVK